MCLGREGMLARSARPVQPPDLPLAALAASWCSMDRTGVTPMPADSSSTGQASSSRTKSPRGRGHFEDRPRLQAAVQVAADERRAVRA